MNEPETVLVVCQCGYQMPRRPARRDLGETWPCFNWYHRSAPEKISYCPICGKAPSALTTSPVKIVGRTANMEGTMGP